MTCPVCGGATYVYTVRSVDCETVKRWRQCRECGYRFTTEETETGPVRGRGRPRKEQDW